MSHSVIEAGKANIGLGASLFVPVFLEFVSIINFFDDCVILM